MAKDTSTVGRRLKSLRTKRRLTMLELSRSSGVNPSVISLIENGIRAPNWRHLQGLSKALGVTIRGLIP